ncbi:MAG: septum formation inhibitor Maf [Gammaproteobacteria bacterium]|nr:septum formation inhibitor Maf [Gammaproteobacteria bacterium]
MQIILGSTSPYRKELLQRFDLAFESAAPDIDESRLAGETPQALVARLAEQKARAVAESYTDALVIGSDQVAVLNNEVLGKPGNHEKAVVQLEKASGETVAFYTGLCLYNTSSKNLQVDVIPFNVIFRKLTRDQIENYLKAEQPYDCAGSFKSEGLGVALFERMEGEDPSALIGLPLIRLCRMLEQEGVKII